MDAENGLQQCVTKWTANRAPQRVDVVVHTCAEPMPQEKEARAVLLGEVKLIPQEQATEPFVAQAALGIVEEMVEHTVMLPPQTVEETARVVELASAAGVVELVEHIRELPSLHSSRRILLVS